MSIELIAAGIGAAASLFPSISSGAGSAFNRVSRSFNYLHSGRQYDQKVIELYGTMRVFGQTQPRPLDDIFTDVRILPKPTLWRRFSLEGLHEQFLAQDRVMSFRTDERMAADELIKTEKKLFILGKPGAGKTTFCKHLAVREARGRGQVGKVPIFITLKQYADTGLSLMAYIIKQFDVCGFPEAEPFVEELLRGGNALVLFDGLDEVTKDANGRNLVAAKINQFSRKYSGCHIAVTCRVAATDYSFEQFRYVEMAEFAPEQVETFVRQWFMTGEEAVGKADKMLTDLEQHNGISDLTRNPLLLTLLCLNYDETMAFPARRVEIYQDALDALLKKWDSSRGVQRGSAYGSLSVGRKQEMLAELAYETYWEGRYFFNRREIEPQLAEYVAGAPEVPARIDIDGEVILQEIVAQHGILAYRATDIVSFSHKTFHEYFAAKQIVDDREAGTFHELLKHVVDDSWKEVFELTASLLRRGAASSFFKLFVQTLHERLYKRPNAVAWLAWVAAAAAQSKSGYHAGATRALFASASANSNIRTGTHDLAYALANVSANASTRDLALALAHDLVRVLELTRNGRLDLASSHALALARARDLDFDFDFTRANDRDLARVRASASVLTRELGLEAFADALEALEIPKAGAVQTREIFREQLKAIINEYHPLEQYKMLQEQAQKFGRKTPDKQLMTKDMKTLINFMRGSNRLYDCLQVAYLSRAERKMFEDQLLLPPDWKS